LLDRINLVDIPAFGKPQKLKNSFQWLNKKLSTLETALIKELLVYYKGGNILAFFVRLHFVDDLADATKNYTHETLTANSLCC
jgi:CRISPR-associated protein Cmr2